jgi:hypothetical protein
LRKPRLPQFVEFEIMPEEYGFLLLLPVFGVAWADGKMQPQEVKNLMAHAEMFNSLGVSEQHPIVEKWLKEPLDAEYITKGLDFLRDLSVHEDFSEITVTRLREVLKLCQEVAQSAGGILGIGTVSGSEKKVMKALEQNIEFLEKAR